MDPVQREVIGLGNQILHCRPITQKKETVAEKRNREDRESLLWIQGVQSLPADEEIVDVCDRGADEFEFLEHEVASVRTFVVRSSTVLVNRKSREAVVHVSASRVTLLAPRRKRGHHGQSPLPMWVVRVWEPHPPEGAEPLEWILLTNHACMDFESAHRVKSWYECRWIFEEYHKGQKTGCGIEKPQFTSSDRLHPMIAILSVVALSLLNLRELSRRDDAKSRSAARLFSVEYIQVLSIRRHGTPKPNWTLYDFCLALARLGGHMNRNHDSHPGWLVLWKGWTKLQAMIDGARTQEPILKCA